MKPHLQLLMEKIKFNINKKTYIATISDVTPYNLKNKRIYEVPTTVQNGTDKKLILTFRNQVFTVLIQSLKALFLIDLFIDLY